MSVECFVQNATVGQAQHLLTGTNSGNVMSGRTFEFVNRAAMALAVGATVFGLTLDILNGERVVVRGGAVPFNAASIRLQKPDDYHYRWIARGRQQIVVYNGTAGTIDWAGILEIQEL